MKPNFAVRSLFLALCILLLVACSGTELAKKATTGAGASNSVSDILVIVVADKDATRRSFEDRFVSRFEAEGINAVSSAAAIPMPSDLKLEKSAILEAVNRYGNDAVLVTHLKSKEYKESYTRGTGSLGYYGYYGSIWGYSRAPGYYQERTTVRLATNLYDVETENLIWSGETKTWNKKSEAEVLDDVVRVVVRDMKKSGLLAPE